ncbi:crosslink repair DNA glycosylase YcaQ family protein [Curtobacterium sp. Csp1]|uniref:DNA glycosylase AlkZ-like family protein n=1 Tax=Curtobacterium sp. Csp1 TaxID=2495429 RepID=UPI0034A0CC5F
MVRTTLSAAEARRVALAAQGFGAAPADTVSTRTLTAGFARLGLLQIDSVNVFERSHYLPLFARLGSYDRATLDRLTMTRRGPYAEYWAHEAAFVARTDLPLFRWRMDAFRERDARPNRVEGVERTAGVRRELLALLEHEANVRRGPWWGWSDVKTGLEQLFRWGEVVSAGRSGFGPSRPPPTGPPPSPSSCGARAVRSGSRRARTSPTTSDCARTTLPRP